MKSAIIPLALLLFFTTSQAAPLPDVSALYLTNPLHVHSQFAQNEIEEGEPLPPVWCVWETNANGRRRHLDCSDPPEGPGIGDPFGPDGTSLGDLDNSALEGP